MVHHQLTAAADMCTVLLQAYDIPNFRYAVRLARCHLPPRTTVRAPGEINAQLVMEHIMSQVALAVGADAAAVRERNMLGMNQQVYPTTAPSNGHANGMSRDAGACSDGQHAHGVESSTNSTSTSNSKNGVDETSLHPDAAPAAGNQQDFNVGQQNGSCNGSQVSSSLLPPHPNTLPDDDEQYVTTILGKQIPARLFTLPYIWHSLKSACSYQQRYESVVQYNACHVWRKKGIAMVPTR